MKRLVTRARFSGGVYAMHLYAGSGHPWFKTTMPWTSADLRRQQLAGLGYHSPNLALTHRRKLERSASASDQEGVITLILTAWFVGLLPDHDAKPFVARGVRRHAEL
ncbi:MULTISPECIES: hypothetical protein [unclassified Roseateles]|uniref:hypothetical protein n=1 Tax=unclassified Roseateles TaxID=2626991 RepID=UPI0006F46C1E|nr:MULTISPECIES: hypothetical protein [unclassified Roseateles]KQW42460.1 hypothetical protein ASC81_21680 [Pelomonas sp. Root405]KRA68334.1 hypothetical protein ASD88_23265 [Pelomonas sp. Root662]